MIADNKDRNQTAFTVTVDAAEGTTTGASVRPFLLHPAVLDYTPALLAGCRQGRTCQPSCLGLAALRPSLSVAQKWLEHKILKILHSGVLRHPSLWCKPRTWCMPFRRGAMYLRKEATPYWMEIDEALLR